MRVIATGLTHGFGSAAPLFTDLSFELVADEVHALVGPSGSGKSTLLAILAGWTQPRAGELVREGVERTAWVFQNPHGVAERSALDHVALPLLAASASHRTARVEAMRFLERFGLGPVARTPFHQLSGGEAQRLMLARGLASAPDLLLVDEPTAQLDRTAADAVNRSLAALASSGVIVVVATHDERTREACTRSIDLGATR